MILLVIVALPVVEWWDDATPKHRAVAAVTAAAVLGGLIALWVTR